MCVSLSDLYFCKLLSVQSQFLYERLFYLRRWGTYFVSTFLIRAAKRLKESVFRDSAVRSYCFCVAVVVRYCCLLLLLFIVLAVIFLLLSLLLLLFFTVVTFLFSTTACNTPFLPLDQLIRVIIVISIYYVNL